MMNGELMNKQTADGGINGSWKGGEFEGKKSQKDKRSVGMNDLFPAGDKVPVIWCLQGNHNSMRNYESLRLGLGECVMYGVGLCTCFCKLRSMEREI